MRRRISLTGVLLVAIAATASAGSTEPPQIGVEVLDRVNDAIPVKLSCPAERVTCKGTASFKGKKERRGKIYRLEAEPFAFRQFRGGRKKTIRFRLSDTAKQILRRANGMKVTVTIKAVYGAGEPGTVRVKATLAP